MACPHTATGKDTAAAERPLQTPKQDASINCSHERSKAETGFFWRSVGFLVKYGTFPRISQHAGWAVPSELLPTDQEQRLGPMELPTPPPSSSPSLLRWPVSSFLPPSLPSYPPMVLQVKCTFETAGLIHVPTLPQPSSNLDKAFNLLSFQVQWSGPFCLQPCSPQSGSSFLLELLPRPLGRVLRALGPSRPALCPHPSFTAPITCGPGSLRCMLSPSHNAWWAGGVDNLCRMNKSVHVFHHKLFK